MFLRYRRYCSSSHIFSFIIKRKNIAEMKRDQQKFIFSLLQLIICYTNVHYNEIELYKWKRIDKLGSVMALLNKVAMYENKKLQFKPSAQKEGKYGC
uniref:Uncharacterized protein n=1 Tax=Rhipicephalus zambeziensis TaxID=60191 RepID=A0A224Y613_9ACAR